MQHPQSFLKRRKFLLLLPAVVWPFAVLIFWLLGGGAASATQGASPANGLNMQLPDAKLKPLSSLDKLSFYSIAHKDSVKQMELAKMDPNLEETDEKEAVKESQERLERVRERVYQPVRVHDEPVAQRSTEVEKLQEMVQAMQQPKADPDMEALNGTLQRLVELQKPRRAEDVKKAARKVFPVQVEDVLGHKGFFGESDVAVDSMFSSEIKAVVHGEQVLEITPVIKFRLLSSVTVNGVRIPSGTFVYGLATIANERVHVSVSSIQYKERIYPVAMKVFDLDGMQGIRIPGSTARDVIKQATEQGVQSVGVMSDDQSIKMQAAAAGIGAVKNLFGRKAGRVRVTIKSGYHVLLRDEKRGDE
jgi:hypothetical protein